MATKQPQLKDYHVNLKIIADVSVRVSARTPEDALIKGREIESTYDQLLEVDEISDGSAEVTGVWTIE